MLYNGNTAHYGPVNGFCLDGGEWGRRNCFICTMKHSGEGLRLYIDGSPSSTFHSYIVHNSDFARFASIERDRKSGFSGFHFKQFFFHADGLPQTILRSCFGALAYGGRRTMPGYCCGGGGGVWCVCPWESCNAAVSQYSCGAREGLIY